MVVVVAVAVVVVVTGEGKKKKKAYIRTVKRNFLTNNINHMLCNS